ncbi:serine protease HTRA1B [Lingula anatina]|uniref:Serine protease HTRA1B n=1 Tax=Lingula anatina TaxID=7574 RepID=A0A1S3H151_LINAN|nr:serine protease HTRA1B [Lingula anatina]|eukprot:XP_013379733.2 serine protease HTRA1B [Lingula anatina]
MLSYFSRKILSGQTFHHKGNVQNSNTILTRYYNGKSARYSFRKNKIIAPKWAVGLATLGLSATLLLKYLPVSEAKSKADDFNVIADVVEEVLPAVVFIEGNRSIFGRSGGSGFIIHEDGVILTNAHVIDNQQIIQIKLQDGTTYSGKVQYISHELDLATVKINARHKLPTLELAESRKVRAGEWVIAMGSPFLLNNSVTVGIISAVNRSGKDLGLGFSDMDYLQTDAAINPGNSGGPLVNLDGKVVGVSRMKLAMASIGFAIPADYVKEFLTKAENAEKQVKSKGTFSMFDSKKRIYLGVSMITLTPAIAWELNRKGLTWMRPDLQGVLVAEVHHPSTAYRAGIRPHDVIVSINGERMRSSQNVHQACMNSESLLITLIRNGKELHVRVTPDHTD